MRHVTGNTRGSLAVEAWLLFHAIFGENYSLAEVPVHNQCQSVNQLINRINQFNQSLTQPINITLR